MFNLYSITLSLFSIAGLLLTAWSLLKLYRSKQSLNWPQVEANLVQQNKSEFNNIATTPTYCYSYHVSGKEYQFNLTSNAKPEDLNSHLPVYYDPKNPSCATATPGINKEHWLSLIIGVLAFLFGATVLAVYF